MIKDTVTVYLDGEMEEYMMVNGRTESNMGEEFIDNWMVPNSLVSGSMGKESNGLMIRICKIFSKLMEEGQDSNSQQIKTRGHCNIKIHRTQALFE